VEKKKKERRSWKPVDPRRKKRKKSCAQISINDYQTKRRKRRKGIRKKRKGKEGSQAKVQNIEKKSIEGKRRPSWTQSAT